MSNCPDKAVTKGGGLGFSPVTIIDSDAWFFCEKKKIINGRKIEPFDIPSCWFPVYFLFLPSNWKLKSLCHFNRLCGYATLSLLQQGCSVPLVLFVSLSVLLSNRRSCHEYYCVYCCRYFSRKSPYKLSSITETSKNWLQARKMWGEKLSWYSSFLVLKRVAASMDLNCIHLILHQKSFKGCKACLWNERFIPSAFQAFTNVKGHSQALSFIIINHEFVKYCRWWEYHDIWLQHWSDSWTTQGPCRAYHVCVCWQWWYYSLWICR